MIYGATGYTGRLATREAIARGAAPVLAGRREEAVAALAREHGLEHRAFGLDDPEALRRALVDVAAVLHCAGPFAWTSSAMVDACLVTGTHYLDITGEIDVFEAIHARGAEALAADVVLLPGVGFDVVPTDCLAARLASEVPEPVSLELAFHADGGGVSRGTMRSMVERMPKAGAVRRDGRLEPVPIAWETREIEFGCGRRWTMTIPWGDVSTAWFSTRIPNIKVLVGVSPAGIARARRLRLLAPIVGLKPVKRALQWVIGRRVTGPSDTQRGAGRSYLWGRAQNARGRGATATFDTPEGYSLTAVAAIDATLRVAAGEVGGGALTPSLAFGADYVETLPGVSKIVVQHDG
jgi:short subunit dehydrogenase-like uncharacterized protein